MSGRRRKDSDLLRVSQRSNGLAFSHHHFLSSSITSPPQSHYTPFISKIDGTVTPRLREKRATALRPVMENRGDETVVIKYRSLIPPAKSFSNSLQRRRNSSSTASLKSFTSSVLRRRKYAVAPNLSTLPVEILDAVCQHLQQPELHALMLTNSNVSEVAASYLYIKPHFASTYRYAQFVWTVSHRAHYAQMVRELDLSYCWGQGQKDGELVPLAGWREFKYRNHDLYHANRDRLMMGPIGVNHQRHLSSSHPPASPLLKSFHRTRDIPVGGLCHVLAACKGLRKVNLSRVQVATDFRVQHESHPPTAFTGLIFVSDVPKSWTWRANELTTVFANEIIFWLMKLEYLETLIARNSLWLTTAGVSLIMTQCQSLKYVDFTASGMAMNVRWATEGSKSEVEKIVKEVIKNTKDRERFNGGPQMIE
ncbi:hypothetical protein F5884DRAFT_47442 [Xylogone sp. PMI_703]|nr:hypothetical protein F5884DRAFT_47442 [Xylogone sp. PMI_703]